MTSGKQLVIGAGAVAAIGGVIYLLRLNRLSKELETVTKASIHSVSLSGIELRIDVTLKNPSGGSVKVKQPFVRLRYGGTTLVSSQMKNVNITVPKFGEASTEPIILNIGLVQLATTAPALLKDYRETGKLTLMVETVTTINDSLPYSKTDNITLGGGREA